MKIRVVDTDSEFDALEESWNRLSDKAAPNFFSSFDYVRTAWKHFRGPNDRLHILVLSEGPSIVGIAPFYIERCRIPRDTSSCNQVDCCMERRSPPTACAWKRGNVLG